MKKLTVAILFGGCSSEYEVSLQSACSVIKALDDEKYEVILLGITREGRWLKYSGGIRPIFLNTWENHESCVPAVISPDRKMHGVLALDGENVSVYPIDVAFPVLHGKNGEDGTIQGLLELAGIPCVGCNTLSSALCMDKDVAHRLVRAAGIATPESIVLDRNPTEMVLLKSTAHLKYPLFVKPANAGSSIGITRVQSAEFLSEAVQTAAIHDRKIVIEEAVDGFEVGCAILGNDVLTLGELDEIELSQTFFDYAEKYTLKTSAIHMPARVDENLANQIKTTAQKIYRALNCKGCARVDLFVTPEHEIVFNEVNTLPGFTAHSRYPNMLKGIGMPFEQMVDALIKEAVH